MKKIISCMLICILMFNFIIASNNVVYAVPAPDDGRAMQGSSYLSNAEQSPNSEREEYYYGRAARTNSDSSGTSLADIGSVVGSIFGAVLGILSKILNVLIAFQIDLIMGEVTYTEVVTGDTTDLEFYFTIDRCVFNRVALFNINYLDVKKTDTEDTKTYKVGDVEYKASKPNLEVKKSVAGVYYFCRNLALVLGFLALIYIGIRMAVSTVASEQAKYKKMLISWVESVFVLFLLVYIISAVITFEEILTDVFYQIRIDIIGGDKVFEDNVREYALTKIGNTGGITLLNSSIMYWVLLFVEIKFFWLYMKRFLMVGFLIMISPLITISYSIDKAGDGKAQAFQKWSQEFLMNVLIQPLHALIYLVLVVTANEIATQAPLVAVLLLFGVSQTEKMVKVIFNMAETASMKGMHQLKVK